MLEHINKCEDVLGLIFLLFITDGYFAWIAEQVLSGNSIPLSQIPDVESFKIECINFFNFVYSDFFKHLQGSSDAGFFSKESAYVFHFFVFTLWNLYSKKDQIFELRSIFKEVQIFCTSAMVSGYVVAIIDAKYRK